MRSKRSFAVIKTINIAIGRICSFFKTEYDNFAVEQKDTMEFS